MSVCNIFVFADDIVLVKYCIGEVLLKFLKVLVLVEILVVLSLVKCVELLIVVLEMFLIMGV